VQLATTELHRERLWDTDQRRGISAGRRAAKYVPGRRLRRKRNQSDSRPNNGVLVLLRMERHVIYGHIDWNPRSTGASYSSVMSDGDGRPADLVYYYQAAGSILGTISVQLNTSSNGVISFASSPVTTNSPQGGTFLWAHWRQSMGSFVCSTF